MRLASQRIAGIAIMAVTGLAPRLAGAALAIPPPIQAGIAKFPALTPIVDAQQISVGNATLYFQQFSGDDFDLPAPGKATFSVEVLIPPPSGGSTGTPAVSIAIDSPAMGKFWMTNSGRNDCWDPRGHIASYTFQDATNDQGGVNEPALNKTALSWCPVKLHEWWRNTPTARVVGPSTDPNSVAGQCQAFEDLNDSKQGAFNKLLTSFEASPCIALTSLIPLSPDSALACAGCAGTFGLCGECCSLCGETAQRSFTVRETARECLVPAFTQSLAELGFRNDIHFVDVSNPPRSLVPVVGLIRSEANRRSAPDPMLPPPSIDSTMTRSADLKLGHLHQLNDWNWAMHDFRTFDPFYLTIGDREFGVISTPWAGSEVELEFGVPHGLWTLGGSDGISYDAHGFDVADLALGVAGKVDFFGEIWPNENCGEFGIDIDDDQKTNSPSFPASRCGKPEKSYLNNWRSHFGRGLFIPAPMPDAIFSGGPSLMTIPPVPPATIAFEANLDIEDWGMEPHRIGFLGQPILDCGHFPYTTEIHPPQLITMPVVRRTYNVDGQVITGVEVATFGWSNITTPASMEFDLWPPPRPGAKFDLVSWGTNHALNTVSTPLGQDDDQDRYGFVIDTSAPQHGSGATLACTPYPLYVPNHVHCVYKDSGAGTNNPIANDSSNYGNRRMTPYFATSRFELRAFMGWRPANCTGSVCGAQGPKITADAVLFEFGQPDVCFHGTGFTKGAEVPIFYSNIPKPCPPPATNCGVESEPSRTAFDAVVDPDGTFRLLDNSLEVQGRICSPEQANGTVTVVATDGGGSKGSGLPATTTVSASLWCKNFPSSTFDTCP